VLGTNTPLKIYEQLASGIPIVATRIHSHTQVLDDEACFLVEPTPDAMAEGIFEALTDTARAESATSRASALYESRYSRPVYEEKMRSLIQLLR
jgi:glycosyltransferase involved in cell wall biosynthesis